MPLSPPAIARPPLQGTTPGGGHLTAGACAQLVTDHGPWVLAACRRVLHDEAPAQHAAQETYLLWVRKADRLPRHTSLPGWLDQAA